MLTDQEIENKKTYNQIAKDWSAASKKNFWIAEREKFAKYLSAGKILDLGCGSGNDCGWFVDKGYELIGIDISEEMLKLAKLACPKGEFLQKSFYDLDFAPGSFEGFWAACSLLHVPKNKIKELLLKIKSFLKVGGVGFIALKNGQGEKMVEWQNSGQKRFFSYYSTAEFTEILKASDFEVLETGEKSRDRKISDEVYLVFYIKAK